MNITCQNCLHTIRISEQDMAQMLGARGGAAGTGEAKRRSKAHYAKLARASKARAKARREASVRHP